MPEKLRDLAEHAISGEMTKQERRVLGKALFRYGWRASLAVFAIWSFGGFAKFGFGGGFALADEQRAVTEQRVEAAVAPINTRLDAIEQAVSKTTAETKALGEIVLRDKSKNLEEKLIETKIRWCKADNQNAKDYFGERLRDYQREYRELTHEQPDFVVPACGDLVASQ